MTKEEKKNKTIAAITSLVVLVIAFILMAFCGLKQMVPPPEAKKVILIEMQMESGGGGGGGNMVSNSSKPRGASAENLLTQQDVSLPSIPTSTREEDMASANDVEEKSNPAPNPNAVYRPGMGGGSGGGSGKGTGSGLGSGIGEGEGTGTGGNIGYGTGGRGYTYMPDVTVNEDGVVYVEVHIEASGKVVEARVINNRKYPTTITNSRIQAECVAKAKTARYKPGKEELRIIVFKR